MPFRFLLTPAPATGCGDAPSDFVRTDLAALASHMQRCAHAHDRLFALRSGLQRMHALAAGRLVTLCCLATVLGVALRNLA